MEEQEGKVGELRSIVEKQEERILTLQSSAFKLANFYFVFQGVVLTAISGHSSSTSLTCSRCWLPFTLSLLAGILNLVALVRIGLSYKRTLSQQNQNKSEYQDELQILQSLRSGGTSSPAATSGSRSPPSPTVVPARQSIWDRCTEAKQLLVFFTCTLSFVAFLCLTAFSCFKIRCSGDDEYCGGDQNCINLCDGAKCINVCREF